MYFRQIKHRGDNFSYLIASGVPGEAAVVDPSFNADLIIDLAKKDSLNIKLVINTHSHWDHVADNKKIKDAFNSRVVAHRLATVDKDVEVVDGDKLDVGGVAVEVIHTPGHTPDSICLLFDSKILTGDTLFVGGCGRVDMPGGSAEDMYNSLFFKLMRLDDEVEVYPGHDYGSKPHSTIGLERKTNYVLRERFWGGSKP